MCLVRGVILRWDTIHGNLSPTLTAAAKHRAWESVKNEVNIAGSTVRPLDEVRNKFTDLKCHTKKKVAALNKDMTGTGENNLTVNRLEVNNSRVNKYTAFSPVRSLIMA